MTLAANFFPDKEVVEAARQLLWRHGSKHLTAEEKYYWTLKEPPPR